MQQLRARLDGTRTDDVEQEDETMAVPTQVVVTETVDDEPTRRLLIDYATRSAHWIRTRDEDRYWRNLARSSSNPEVVAGGRWSRDRVVMHCRQRQVDLDG